MTAHQSGYITRQRPAFDATKKATDALVALVDEAEVEDYNAAEWAQIVLALRAASGCSTWVEVRQ